MARFDIAGVINPEKFGLLPRPFTATVDAGVYEEWRIEQKLFGGDFLLGIYKNGNFWDIGIYGPAPDDSEGWATEENVKLRDVPKAVKYLLQELASHMSKLENREDARKVQDIDSYQYVGVTITVPASISLDGKRLVMGTTERRLVW